MGLFRFLLQQRNWLTTWKLLQSYQPNEKADESTEDFTPANAEDDKRIVDTAIQSLQSRFEQLKTNHNLFGFLISIKSLQFVDIQTFAESLEQALKYVGENYLMKWNL